jgi:hypothetical protein
MMEITSTWQKVEEIFVSLFPQARPKIIVSKRKCRKSKQRKKNLKHIMQLARNYLKYTSNMKHKKDETT